MSQLLRLGPAMVLDEEKQDKLANLIKAIQCVVHPRLPFPRQETGPTPSDLLRVYARHFTLSRWFCFCALALANDVHLIDVNCFPTFFFSPHVLIRVGNRSNS